MSSSDDLLEVLQADVAAVLSLTPQLSTACVLADNEGDIESRVLKALAPMTETGGKVGLAIVVLCPEVSKADKNLPGPPLSLMIEIQVIEDVLLNRDEEMGSGQRSTQAALIVLSVLQLYNFGGLLLYADKNPLTPVTIKPGYVSHKVTLYAAAQGLNLAKTSPVLVAIDDSPFHQPGQPSAQVIIFGCETPSVDIFYTTDGSYPSPATGTPYTTFIAMPAAGTIIRAAAYSPAMTPSDILEFTVTP